MHEWVTAPSLSRAPIFVIANWTPGPGEAHYSPHRFIVSAFLLQHEDLLEDDFYVLADQYMTTRFYNLQNILRSEEPEILKRLQRVIAEQKRLNKRRSRE